MDRRPPLGEDLSPAQLAELVAAEADPFTFSLREFQRLVDRLAPGATGVFRGQTFAELPEPLRRVAWAALRAETTR